MRRREEDQNPFTAPGRHEIDAMHDKQRQDDLVRIELDRMEKAERIAKAAAHMQVSYDMVERRYYLAVDDEHLEGLRVCGCELSHVIGLSMRIAKKKVAP